MKNTIFNIKKTGIIVLLLAFCLITGCTADKEDKDNKETNAPSEVQTNAPEATQAPNPNVMEITGYEYYEDAVASDEEVRLVAKYIRDSMIGENYINYLSIMGVDDGVMALECQLSNVSPYNTSEDTKLEFVHKIVSVDINQKKIIKEIILEDDSYYIDDKSNCFILNRSTPGGYNGVIYDYRFNMKGEVSFPKETLTYYNDDGTKCYYIDLKKVHVYNVADGSTKTIKPDMECSVEGIGGVLTTDTGEEYIIINALCEDFNNYSLVVNCENGHVEYVDNSQEIFWGIENNVYIGSQIEGMAMNHWITTVDENKILDYYMEDANEFTYYSMLDNKDMLFIECNDKVLTLELREFSTGKLLGTTNIEVPCSDNPEIEIEGEVGSGVGVGDAPKYIDEDTLLLPVNNIDGEIMFYMWDYKKSDSLGERVTVKEYKKGTYPSVEIEKKEVQLYTPGELSEELLPLKEKTDALEEKHGVEIFIGEECGNCIGGYSVSPYTEYEHLEEVIEEMERQMAKYPDGFFEQLKFDYIESIEFHLGGLLYGVADDVLSQAGGFKVTEGSKVVIVVDCNDPIAMISTLHHELAHLIDDKIARTLSSDEYKLDFNTEWEKLNPCEGIYTNTYDEYGFEEYYKYVYDNVLYNSKDFSQAYFVDYYSMTFPTEDRARLFESVMGTYSEYSDTDFNKAIHLKEKINFYADCMRKSFDTTGWENVEWEKYK